MPETAPVRWRPEVHLSKSEAFDACQALADADRCLVRAGHAGEAAALARLFEVLESRLGAPASAPAPEGDEGGAVSYASEGAAFSSAGS